MYVSNMARRNKNVERECIPLSEADILPHASWMAYMEWHRGLPTCCLEGSSVRCTVQFVYFLPENGLGGVGGRGRWFLHLALQKVCFQLSLPGQASDLPSHLPHTSDFLVTQMPFSCKVAAISRLLLQGLSPSPLSPVLLSSKERQKLIVLSPPIPVSHLY